MIDNFVHVLEDDLYANTYINSVRIAGISTLISLLICYPIAYGIVRSKPVTRNLLLMAVILPFWTSFLLRVYAWMGLLADQATINNLLIAIGLVDEPIRMLYTDFAVDLGIVYTYLPFVVLPLYANMEKLDASLLEAAADLGARPINAFLTVTLPLTVPGIIAGALLMFIPATGEYVIPDLLGGGNVQMIGRVLYNEFHANHDWPSTRGFSTITITHITFSLAYVAVIIQSRLTGMGQDLEEAALDLGAKPFRMLMEITLPRLAPGMLAGWLLALTLSLDDLVIASFVTGPGSSTLPILIYSRIRLGLRPDINAIATIIILSVAIGVAIAAYLMLRQHKQAAAESAAR